MKKIDLLDLTDTERELIRECEVQGTRSLFERNGRGVAILISWDEYVAMHETLDIGSDALLCARIETSEEQIRQGKALLVEDLLENGSPSHER